MNKATIIDQLLKYSDQPERAQAKYEAHHPDLCAYERAEQALRNLLTGRKLAFSVLGSGKVIIGAGRKVTNTLVKQMIEARKDLCTAPSDPRFAEIQQILRAYDKELSAIKAK